MTLSQSAPSPALAPEQRRGRATDLLARGLVRWVQRLASPGALPVASGRPVLRQASGRTESQDE